MPQAGWTQSYPGRRPRHRTPSTLTSPTRSTNGNDFGNWTPATKTGMKFEDLDADGVKDAGEPGLARLDDRGGRRTATSSWPSTTTAANGSYSFSLKPGTYTFREVQQAGWTQSYPAAPGTYTETLTSHQVVNGNDFGNWTPATKTGMKFEDLDADGVKDAGEPGLSGWTIESVTGQRPARGRARRPPPTAATRSALKPGTYTVREVAAGRLDAELPGRARHLHRDPRPATRS